jgi:hypothetical protein
MWTYNQQNGVLLKDGETMGTGYSGFEAGKNNPAMQRVEDVGPIPKGVYEIGSPHDTASHGPHVMALSPAAGTETFGRSGFLIHGDSVADPGAASHGCIILARDLRDKISASGDDHIEVV